MTFVSRGPESQPGQFDTVRPDFGTLEFINRDPVLAAKLFHLEGFRPLRQQPFRRQGFHSGSSEPADTFERRLSRWNAMMDVGGHIERKLRETGRFDTMEPELSFWQNGFPPLGADFGLADRSILAETAETSSFVRAALEILPPAPDRPLGRVSLTAALN